MTTVEQLLERSVELKQELLEFLRDKRISREFEEALHQRYGSVATGDEDEVAIFFDSFLLGYRLRDGRTPVERFVRARGDLPRADRDLMLGWVDPLESVFEAGQIQGETLSAANPVAADTVGMIFDVDEGLGYYEDFGLLWSAFADSEPSRAALRLVRGYLESPITSPLPLRRCVAAFPDRADGVFGAALGRKKFSWARDGEALLRRHKPGYQGVPHPGVSVVSDRLRPYLEAGRAADAGSV